jgi:phosphatidate phosphatase APP1
MFGVSGEKDSEVYAYIKNKYPKNVLRYYIRDVESGEILEYK